MSFLNPETFVEGGGLIDDVDVTFKEVRVVNYDYNGKVAIPSPALRVLMELEDGSTNEQYYSAGKATDWQPNDDGTEFVAVGKATGLSSSSNCAIFIMSIINAGFPVNKVGDDVRCFEGLKAHMTQIPAPKRAGLTPQRPREDGRVFEKTILTVASIIALPGEKPKSGKPAAGKPATGTSAKPAGLKPAAPAAPADADNLDSACSEILLEILAEAGEPIPKKRIPVLVMPKVKDNPLKNKIITRVFAEDFLNKADGWTYENGEISLG